MEQFTASEVRAYTHKVGDGIPMLSDMLRTFADMLEAQEKAVPVVTRESAINALAHVGQHNGPGREAEARQMLVEGSPSATHSAQAQPPADQFDPERNVRPGDVGTEMQTAEQDAADFGTGFEVDGRRVAPERVRIFRGEQADQLPSDAERLSEALREFDGSFLKELADLVSFPEDDRGCINRSFVMGRVVGLRRCWDKLSATRNANSAQAQSASEGAMSPYAETLIGQHVSCIRAEALAIQKGVNPLNCAERIVGRCDKLAEKIRESAQPPAASLTFATPETEEDVMAYLRIAKLHIKRFREILQAVLAAQPRVTDVKVRASALLDLLESDFGQSGRDVRVEAIACELCAASLPDASWFSSEVCEARNQWAQRHEMNWLETDENHPDDFIGKWIRDKLLAAQENPNG